MIGNEKFVGPVCNLVPTVIKKSKDGERAFDIYSRMLDERIVFVTDEIGGACDGNLIAAQLYYLDSLDSTKPIYMYMNTPGGSVIDGEVVINAMYSIQSEVWPICTGLIASMGAVIFSCGTKGKRFMMPYSDAMLLQVSTGNNQQNIQDLRVSLQFTERLNERTMKLLAKNCGKTYKQLLSDTNRDLWLSPEEAVKYGLADAIKEFPKK